MQSPDAEAFLIKLMEMLEFLLPGYVKEGKHQLVIAIGCTGGHHRSVTFANKLADYINGLGHDAVTIHRDIKI